MSPERVMIPQKYALPSPDYMLTSEEYACVTRIRTDVTRICADVRISSNVTSQPGGNSDNPGHSGIGEHQFCSYTGI